MPDETTPFDPLTSAWNALSTMRDDLLDVEDLVMQGVERRQELSEYASDLEDTLGTTNRALAEANEEIVRLAEELAKRQPLPEPPKPEEAAPDVEVTFMGQVFRPTMTMSWMRRGKERIWGFGGSLETLLLIYARDDGQLRVATEYCWSDLSWSAPVLETHLKIVVDGKAVYDAPLRLTHHTRPGHIVRRGSWTPTADLKILAALGAMPPYRATAKPTEAELAAMALRKKGGAWEYWNSGGLPYDRWSEEFGPVMRSFTGGLPWPGANERGWANPQDMAYALSSDERAWAVMEDALAANGCFPVHVRNRETGRMMRAAEAGNLPLPMVGKESKLTADGLPRGITAAGVKHPLTDVAHGHPLAYVIGLLTGDLYAYEEQEATALVAPLTRTGTARLEWDTHSGQTRQAASALMHLLQLWHLATGEDRAYYGEVLRKNLRNLAATYADLNAPAYRASGITGTIRSAFGSKAETLQYVRNPDAHYNQTWGNYVYALALQMCVESGFAEAVPMRDHVLKVIENVVKFSPTPFLWAWGEHVVALYDAEKKVAVEVPPNVGMALTFEGMVVKPTQITPPIDSLYLSFTHAAIWSAKRAGKDWAPAALDTMGKSMLKPDGAVAKSLVAQWDFD